MTRIEAGISLLSYTCERNSARARQLPHPRGTWV